MGRTKAVASNSNIKEESSLEFSEIVGSVWKKYNSETSKELKLLDTFLAYVLCTGVVQMIYCLLVGNFPFNAFLAGFICTVGVFVLTGKSY